MESPCGVLILLSGGKLPIQHTGERSLVHMPVRHIYNHVKDVSD